jgi:hypothetical protein
VIKRMIVLPFIVHVLSKLRIILAGIKLNYFF